MGRGGKKKNGGAGGGSKAPSGDHGNEADATTSLLSAGPAHTGYDSPGVSGVASSAPFSTASYQRGGDESGGPPPSSGSVGSGATALDGKVPRSAVGPVDAAESSSHGFDSDSSAPDDEDALLTVAQHLEDRHEKLNHMFGTLKWKGHVAHRPLRARSKKVRSLYAPMDSSVDAGLPGSHGSITGERRPGAHGRGKHPAGAPDGDGSDADGSGDGGGSGDGDFAGGGGATAAGRRFAGPESRMNVGNVAWLVLFGWWLCFLYLVVGLVLAGTIIGIPYARKCLMMADFYLWPFGKFIERRENRTPAMSPSRAAAGILWGIVSPVLFIGNAVCAALCWLSVVMIPMAKVNVIGMRMLFTSTLRLRVRRDAPSVGSEIVLYNHDAANSAYFKYSVGGMNVTLVNLLPFVVVVIGIGWGSDHEFQKKNAGLLFPMSLLSTIPLSYYIGTAISRLTAQTSFAIGAVLNATFGSIVEIILYISALFKGHYDLTLGSLTGTFLGQLVFVPGLSFVAGGLKFKEQRFNKEAAGVSSIMVILAVVGVYLPTMLYEMNRVEEFRCTGCTPGSTNATMNCPMCSAHEGVRDEVIINEVIIPIANGMAVILPITYLVGLVFTLKTHAHLYEEDEEEEADKVTRRHISEWSRSQCLIILFVSTVMFALVAEVLTNVLNGALDQLGISEAFAGLFLISTVANLTEIVNAVRFALNDNISLSLEIGSSAAIQCAFIQVPILILVSRIGIHDFHFLFDQFSALAIVFAVIIFNYLSIDGRCNYFEGFVLMTLYALLTVAFYYLQRVSPTHKP